MSQVSTIVKLYISINHEWAFSLLNIHAYPNRPFINKHFLIKIYLLTLSLHLSCYQYLIFMGILLLRLKLFVNFILISSFFLKPLIFFSPCSTKIIVKLQDVSHSIIIDVILFGKMFDWLFVNFEIIYDIQSVIPRRRLVSLLDPFSFGMICLIEIKLSSKRCYLMRWYLLTIKICLCHIIVNNLVLIVTYLTSLS